MGIVSTIPEKCRRCYTCVRECPAKAIKVEKGQATVLDDRCIACGNCVKVCAQQAKRIEDGTAAVAALLRGGAPVVACLAPSFPAAFHPVAPGRVIAAVRRLGFHQVWPVAFGAELVSRAYLRLFERTQRTGRCVITTPCPAIVEYVEKFLPSLHGALAPIVSPMVAAARAVRRRLGPEVRVVFIGPCVAKKREAEDAAVRADVAAVLTFKELNRLFEDAALDLAALPESDFDGPPSVLGGAYPISGGLLRSSGLSADILEKDIVVTEGKNRVLDALRELEAGQSRARLLDVLFCEGCIDGPKMLGDLSVFARREIIADFVKRQARAAPADHEARLAEFADLDLGRSFEPEPVTLPVVPEEQIARALAQMRKTAPGDQLNCGACGYATCRDKAVAVCQGLAEPEMCLPYLIEELQATCASLASSNQALAAAQQRLVQTERLASMGQLSAGIAHEINNPLGTVLIYSHMLLRQLEQAHPLRGDLQMIVDEATRCKTIVRGLLDFARQSRVDKAPTDLARLLRDVAAVTAARASAAGARVEVDLPDSLPEVWLDATQIKQLLVNLADNALDAVGAGGVIRLAARTRADGRAVTLTVTDNGCGIPAENLPKLFDPFFTTKEMGQGTGLGLAIAYGIVKMHHGDITVDSEPGRGTTFTVVLPIGRETPPEPGAGSQT
jgi:signal transduction histidine kinase/iron only hydrogenase large subunit-like protein